MKHYDAYTYIIKCPNGKSYYGYRSANKVSPEDDLWKVYFTSSKRIKELRMQYDDAEFVASVDRTFKTAEEAHEYETKFLTENDCVHSDDWLNEHCFPVFASNKGREISDEWRKNISESLKGEKNPMFGREFTDEHRKKMSEAKKGVKLSDKHRKKISETLKGVKLSDKHRKNISESKKGEKNPMFGKKLSDEHRKNLSVAHMGKKLSDETKKKMSEAKKGVSPWNKGKTTSKETKKKISETQKRRYAKEKRNKENVSIEIHG